ncbi:hypothetical protein ACUNWD_04760 [Sunxiuqinia sp. A32]|uniref:hypothetical protein n=1 Tax=Sunxiuqinia sp. A32 TaxID=3461496 RepID=UPI00404622E2
MKTKELLLEELVKQFNQKIELLNRAIETAKESRDNETKSSVGDKYETGRAMVQMEIEKNLMQLVNLQKQKNELMKIDPDKKSNGVEFGSLVITDQGNYFFSIAYGKIEMDDNSWFCLSISSPIGKHLLGKKVGDHLMFRNQEITIKEIH